MFAGLLTGPTIDRSARSDWRRNKTAPSHGGYEARRRPLLHGYAAKYLVSVHLSATYVVLGAGYSTLRSKYRISVSRKRAWQP